MIPTDTIDKLEAIWRSVSDARRTTRRAPVEAAHRARRLDRARQPCAPHRHRADAAGPAGGATPRVRRRTRQEPDRPVQRSRGRGPPRPLRRRGAGGMERARRAARRATLRTADDDYFAKEMATPTGPGTMADFLHIRVLDCWIHEQDMRRAVGKPGHLWRPGGGAHDRSAAAHHPDRRRASGPRHRKVVPWSSTSRATSAGRSCARSTAGRAAIVESADERALATVVLDSEAFIVLATGRQHSGG